MATSVTITITGTRSLTISAKEVLIVGYWPKRYVGGSGNEYILSPKGWEFALLQ